MNMRVTCTKRFPRGGAGADRKLFLRFHYDLFDDDAIVDLGPRWTIRFHGGRFVR